MQRIQNSRAMYIVFTTILMTLALAAFTAGGAYACDCEYGPNNTIGVANGNKNVNVSTNGNNNLNSNANVNANTNENNSTAGAAASANAQSTSAAVAGASGGNATGQGGNSSASTNVSIRGDDAAASSAAPVYLTTSNDTCMGSSGVGGQGMTFGFSIGTTWTDKNCVMLKNAREMKNQGYDKAAKIRLCMDEDNAIAFEAAGDPCPQALKTAQNAAAMMKDKRVAALAPAAGAAKAADKKKTDSAAAAAGVAAPVAIAAFMLDSGNKVFFDYDKSDLKPKARKTLDKQAAWLKEHEQVRILVEGHCDERGTREYNLALGERRANSVKQYLVGKGIAADRIDTVSYGKDRPAVVGSTEEAWSQNRRAVTQILPPKKAPAGGQQSSEAPRTTQQASLGHADHGNSAQDLYEANDFFSAMADVTNSPE